MIRPRKQQLVVALILACTCTAVPAQEPNEPKMPETKLKFEISNDLVGYSGISSIKPTHAARLFVNYTTSLPHPSRPDDMKRIFETSAGQALSPKQREFLLSSKYADYGNRDKLPPGYDYFYYLYAVSEDDAKKMAEVVVELLTNTANERMGFARNTAEELRGNIAEAKKKISEKEAEAKAAQAKLDELKKTSPYRSAKEAEDAISEFNRILSTSEVEIAGIRASLQAIEEFQAKGRAEGFATNETSDKLEQMAIEETIKLRAAEARKQTAERLRGQAEALAQLNEKLDNALAEKDRLAMFLADWQASLAVTEARLANPTPEMLPPKVYQNKATIYPVRADE
ncbi:MAG TPA: hypothetical protein VMW16_11505 [Sedimentisphaerales bacterium]|nr:hypothetical protein [Sedimentisphaerales bacterium]